MKKPVICFPFVGDTVGGSHRSATILIKGLRKANYPLEVILYRRGLLADYLVREGVPFKVIPLGNLVGEGAGIRSYLQATARTVAPLVRYIYQNNIHVVHTNDARMHLTWTVPCMIGRARHVWHQRTKFACSRLLRLYGAFASRVVAISRYTKSTMPALLRRRAKVVYNPVEDFLGCIDKDDTRRMLLAETGWENKNYIIGFFNNLVGQKRPEIFIDLARKLVEMGDQGVGFVVVGRDYERRLPALEKRVEENGLDGSLKFLGFRNAVEHWISACDVIVAPALEEAFGRTIVEAFSVHTPVVAVDSGGHGEIIEDGKNGYLVPEDDTTEMAMKVRELILRPDVREKLVVSGRHTFIRRFSAHTHIRSMMDLYERL